MEVSGPAPSSSQGRGILRWLVAGTFVSLALLLLVLYFHAATGNDTLLFPGEILALALGGFTISSFLWGILYSWRAFPQHRRAILFVVGITLIVLLAHAYIIGSPPASNNQAPISGPVGTQLVGKDSSGNTLVTVTSLLSGTQLNVTVDASGSDAIVNPEVSVASQLSGAGFAPSPTYQYPLEPGSSVTGTWTVSSPVTNLSVSYQSLNCYKTSSPSEYGCIMDEIFYVPEGMAIYNGQQCSTGNGAPTDCHLEHPWLVPGLIAAGMAIFGEFNVVGWRLMPALLGTFSIPILFGIAWKVSGSKKAAYLSSILLGLDVMFFSQSSAALLDIPEIFFALAAFFAYFVGLKVWKFDKYVIAGVLMGAAGLAKETAVFLALALITYVLLFDEGNFRHRSFAVLKVALVVGLVFAGGLEAYDSVLVTPSSPGTVSCPMNGSTFVQQIGYILCYGSSLIAAQLACSPTTGYWCKYANDPGGPPILPTDWVTYYSPVAYYETSVSVCPNSVNGVCESGAYSYVALAYYGVTNFLETWTIYVWIPLVAYALYSHFRRKQPVLEQFVAPVQLEIPSTLPGELKLAAFALILFLWAYVPYLFLLLAGRVTYPFYFLPAVPAVAVGCTYWLTRSWFPRWLMVVYVAVAFVFFFIYFPEKGFLPDWLRVLIGH